LTGEATFLARLVTEMLPEQAEGLGLLALMRYARSRRRARRTQDGEYVPLDEQNARLWDSPMMAEAEGLLRRATAIGCVGRYQTEAALQSAHAHRRLFGRGELGRNRSVVRRSIRNHWFAGSGDQSRACGRGEEQRLP
jgi:predicted RNA polymerase sigma factor